MIGQLVDRRYQIVRVLGAGAFGQTFLAQDIKCPGHPSCVVKQLRYLSNNPQGLQTARRLFKKEAEILEKLGQHEQIPTLLADLEENQEFYLVQQFISGHPLTQEILPGQPWSEDRVINLLTEVLQILVFVHGQGVIHRDIKPANLMRRQPDQKIFLIDFGAVKEIGTQMVRGQIIQTVVIGTPGYMPIEQFHGQPQFNSDIYALGMLAIQALLGLAANDLSKLRDPNNPNTGEVVWRNRVQVSSELADAIDKMVRPGYLQRYQSATDVLADLGKIGVSSLNYGYHSTSIYSIKNIQNKEQNQPQKKRRRILAASTALIVLGSLAGVVYSQMPQTKAIAFYNQGLEKAKTGDKQAAIEQFNQAIQLNPNYAQAYYERADARFHLADYQGAIEDATQAIRINPNYADAYRRRCAAQGNLKNYQASIEDCTQAIRIDPVNALTYVNRASTYYSLGDKQKSIADSSQAIQINPKLSLAYISRGLAREDLGDRLGAIEDYTLAINLAPNDTRSYINRSNLYRKLGNYQEALKDANQVIQIKPNNSLAYYNRGLAHRALGEKQSAIEDFQKTAKLCLEQGNQACYKDAQFLIDKIQNPEPAPKPETPPVTVSQPQSQPEIAPRRRRRQPNPITVVQPEPNIQNVPPPLRPQPEPTAEAIPEPETIAEPKPQPEPTREATPGPDPKTVPYYKAQPQPEPEPTSEPQPTSEPEPKTESKSERGVQTVPYRYHTRPTPESEPTVEPESTPTPEPPES